MTPKDLEAMVAANRDLFHTRWRGLEFGSGWGELFSQILDQCRHTRAPLITVTKEKLGSLRACFEDQSHPTGRAIREQAMRRSEVICEVCGRPGTTVVIAPGFVGTRCRDHTSE